MINRESEVEKNPILIISFYQKNYCRRPNDTIIYINDLE